MAAASGVKVLGSWSSPYSNRVQITLNLKCIDYEFIEENFYMNHKSERLVKANPVHKKIPVLIHDEKAISESLVILQYIDEAWTSDGPPILPSDPYDRAIARFWAAYIDDKWFPLLKELEKASGEEGSIIGNIFEGLMMLEEAFVKCSKGKDYFGGDNVGYIDVVLGSYLGWIKVIETGFGLKLLDASRVPGLSRWAHSFSSHHATKDVVPQADKLVHFFMMVQATKTKSSSASTHFDS